jgi:hypothetical protein
MKLVWPHVERTNVVNSLAGILIRGRNANRTYVMQTIATEVEKSRAKRLAAANKEEKRGPVRHSKTAGLSLCSLTQTSEAAIRDLCTANAPTVSNQQTQSRHGS